MANFFTRKVIAWFERRRPAATIVTAALHFRLVQGPGREIVIRWDEVARVTAFKRDVYAYDLICLAIESTGVGVVEVNESMTGWNSLVNALQSYLPDAVPLPQWTWR